MNTNTSGRRTRSARATAEVERRKSHARFRRFCQPLKMFIARKYPEIMREYVILYGYLDFMEPNRRNLVNSLCFRLWLENHPPSPEVFSLYERDGESNAHIEVMTEGDVVCEATIPSGGESTEGGVQSGGESSEGGVPSGGESTEGGVQSGGGSSEGGVQSGEAISPEEDDIINGILRELFPNDTEPDLFSGITEHYEPFDFSEVEFDFAEV